MKPSSTGETVWKIEDDGITIGINNRFAKEYRKSAISYTFDGIFDQQDNAHIYNNSIEEVIDSAFDGINALIFAYGQACSGKNVHNAWK